MDAVERMRAAGLRPEALADFFERLRKESEDTIQLPAWLGTHPDLAERVRAVRARAEARMETEPKPLELDWNEVRRHAGFTDDEDQKDGKGEKGEQKATPPKQP